MNQVSINFSALTNQQMQFKAFRKLRSNDERKETYKNVKSVREYIDGNIFNYWYSMYPNEGFEEVICNNLSPRSVVILWMEDEIRRIQNFISNDSYLKINRYSFKVFFILKSHLEGKEVVGIEPYFLEQTNEYGLLIDFKFARIGSGKIQSVKELVLSLSLSSDLRANRNYYTDKYEKIKIFAQKFFSYFRSSPLNFKKFTELEVSKLSAKQYLFSKNVDYSQLNGLSKYGPFQKLGDVIKLIFLYKEGEERLARELLDKLNGQHKEDKTFKGFNNIFKSSIKVIPLKYTDKNPNRICTDILNLKEENFLVIIFQNNNISSPENNDFYYQMKNLLIKNNIPSQFISYAVINKKFTTSNIALQIFSKLGGIPWTVKPQNENCLIVGLAQIKHSSLYNEESYYGYSVLLDSSGIYKEINALENGRPLRKEEYLEKLSESLINIINKNEKYEKIVIHAPFKERAEELSRISSKIREFSGQEKEIVLMRINSDNKFFGYSLNTNAFVPQEGSLTQISRNQFLIWFEGLNDENAVSKTRYSGPTLVDFHYCNKELTLKDKKDFLQDVFNLSGANWRGFNAKSVPVSIFYCKILTKFISEFRERNLQSLQISSINPWFL